MNAIDALHEAMDALDRLSCERRTLHGGQLSTGDSEFIVGWTMAVEFVMDAMRRDSICDLMGGHLVVYGTRTCGMCGADTTWP